MTTDKDGLVRRVFVQPHKKQGQTTTPQLKERAIHDLVLIKAITAQDNPYPDSTTIKTAPSEAKVLKCSFTKEDRKLFANDPQERPNLFSSDKMTSRTSQDVTQPVLPIDSPTEEEIFNLQTTANALLNKIKSMRQTENKIKLDPEAPLFIPTHTVLTTAEIHQPKIKSSITKELKDKKHVRWCPQLIQTHDIEATGLLRKTNSIKEEIERWTTQRDIETNRTKIHRDQVIDIIINMCQLDAWNKNEFPVCPSPTTLFKDQC